LSLDKTLPEIVRVFTSADGNLFAESYNQLNAYFATIPSNYRHKLRRQYLLNSNYADLSFLFTILPGETRNEHLSAECPIRWLIYFLPIEDGLPCSRDC
jgi:type IV secretory pathway VirB4 component